MTIQNMILLKKNADDVAVVCITDCFLVLACGNRVQAGRSVSGQL